MYIMASHLFPNCRFKKVHVHPHNQLDCPQNWFSRIKKKTTRLLKDRLKWGRISKLWMVQSKVGRCGTKRAIFLPWLSWYFWIKSVFVTKLILWTIASFFFFQFCRQLSWTWHKLSWVLSQSSCLFDRVDFAENWVRFFWPSQFCWQMSQMSRKSSRVFWLKE